RHHVHMTLRVHHPDSSSIDSRDVRYLFQTELHFPFACLKWWGTRSKLNSVHRQHSHTLHVMDLDTVGRLLNCVVHLQSNCDDDVFVRHRQWSRCRLLITNSIVDWQYAPIAVNYRVVHVPLRNFRNSDRVLLHDVTRLAYCSYGSLLDPTGAVTQLANCC